MAYLLSKLLPLPLPPHGLNLILIVLVVCQIGRWHWPVLSAFCCFGFVSGLVSQCLWLYNEAPWQRRAPTAVLRTTRLSRSVVDGILPRVPLE